jgi:hypothetical protein
MNIVAILKFNRLFFSEDKTILQVSIIKTKFRNSVQNYGLGIVEIVNFVAYLVTFWTPYMSLEDSLQQRNEKMNKQSFCQKKIENLASFDANHFYKF